MIQSTSKPTEPLPKHLPATLKINHPKLAHLSFTYPAHHYCTQVFRDIADTTLLRLFTNYHFALHGNRLSPKQQLSHILPQNNTLELDVVFSHYNYASAMHHFQQVSRLIANPARLLPLLRTEQKDTPPRFVEAEHFTRELLPSSFKIAKHSIQEIISPNYQTEIWSTNPNEHPPLLEFLSLSGFHPPTQAQLAGDLFYIHAKTLENTDLHITASPTGFYLNQSKINNYNPASAPGRPVYTSLIDLFNACSERFSISFAKLSDPNEQTLLDRMLPGRDMGIALREHEREESKWMDSAPQEHFWNGRTQHSLNEVENLKSSITDWNELFLQIEKQSEHLQKTTNLDHAAWEAQELNEAYFLFERAAVEGTKKIIDGKLQAMNHSDERRRHIYVHDRIFFSTTHDASPSSLPDKPDEMIPTGSSANTDLHNLSELLRIRPPTLHLLHTVLVFYRGYRVVAQTILPGLLSTELSVLTQYGSVDDSKEIHNNADFHQLLRPICSRFHLDEQILALDKENKVVEVAISPEIKGIRSSNGELYICDLQRMSPRDLNYPGPEHESCVLRHELIRQFIQEKGTETVLPINPNINTSIKFLPNEKTPLQETQLKTIASYLKQEAISRLAFTLKSKAGSDYLTDSQGLSSVFHSHGVNMRYLGYVERHELLKDAIQVKICLQRAVLVRCLKRIFRNALREINPLHLSTTIAHMLNCLFARSAQIAQLVGIEQSEEKHETNEPKRKKKKKTKEEQPKNCSHQQSRIIKIPNSHYQNIRPQQLWKEVSHLAKNRFDFSVEEPSLQLFCRHGLFRLAYQKYATLRDLCLSIGLVLEKKNYNLKESDTEETLPFHSRNILAFIPKVKRPNLFSSEIQWSVIMADKLFNQSQFPQALKAYEEALILISEKKEGRHLSHCLGQISRIHYMVGRLREALTIETSNLGYILKALRQDSFEAVRCYSRLGLYCMSLGVGEAALWLLGRGLQLMLCCFGEVYPDVLVNFANIARVYQLNRQTQLASNCYLKAIDLLNVIHGSRQHINASFCYSSLASLYYETGQYRRSVEYQNETVNILLKTLPTDDSRNIDAQKILKVYRQIYLSQSRPANDHRERRK